MKGLAITSEIYQSIQEFERKFGQEAAYRHLMSIAFYALSGIYVPYGKAEPAEEKTDEKSMK